MIDSIVLEKCFGSTDQNFNGNRIVSLSVQERSNTKKPFGGGNLVRFKLVLVECFWEVIRFREWWGATMDLSKCSLITVFELMNDGKEWEFCWMHDYSRYGPSIYQVPGTRHDTVLGIYRYILCRSIICTTKSETSAFVTSTTNIYVYIPYKPVLVLQIPYVRSTGQAIPCSRWWFIFPSTLAIFVVDRRWCCRPS